MNPRHGRNLSNLSVDRYYREDVVHMDGGISLSHRKEGNPATEGIMPKELSQAEKDKHHMTHLYVECTATNQTHRHTGQSRGCQRWSRVWGEMGEGGKKMSNLTLWKGIPMFLARKAQHQRAICPPEVCP